MICYNKLTAGSKDEKEVQAMEELYEIGNAFAALNEEGQEEFLAFIRYAAARLKTGDSVQAIWSDYLAKASK